MFVWARESRLAFGRLLLLTSDSEPSSRGELTRFKLGKRFTRDGVNDDLYMFTNLRSRMRNLY